MSRLLCASPGVEVQAFRLCFPPSPSSQFPPLLLSLLSRRVDAFPGMSCTAGPAHSTAAALSWQEPHLLLEKAGLTWCPSAEGQKRKARSCIPRGACRAFRGIVSFSLGSGVCAKITLSLQQPLGPFTAPHSRLNQCEIPGHCKGRLLLF